MMNKNARLVTEQQKQQKHNRQVSNTPHSPHPLLKLQNNAGNHAIQAKLSVNPPGDIYEQEADHVASRIIHQEQNASQDSGNNSALMRQVEEEEEPIQAKFSNSQLSRQEEEEEEVQPKRSPGFVQRQDIPEEEEAMLKPSPDFAQRQEEEELIQPKRSDSTLPEIGTSLEQRINAAHGSGQQLPPSVSRSFGSQMGHDLSQVQVHTGAEAHSLSRSLQAEAFTTGNDIFFRSGRYNPGSESGRELLAHEVTHVVQQGAAPALRKEE